jgi:hypothetical protein
VVPPAPVVAPAQLRIEHAVVHAPDVRVEDLGGALELRAPGLALHEHRAGGFRPPADRPWAYVDIRRRPLAGFRLTIILSDGRAWDRDVDVAGEQTARVLAVEIANLVAAIEDDRVEADRADVPVPLAEPEPAPAPAPATDREIVPAAASPSAAPPAWEIGVPLHGAVVLGLGPPGEPQAPAAAGAGLGLSVRAPSGLLLGVDGRVGGRSRDDFALLRGRVVFGAGYGLRRGPFALDVRGGLGVEPWSVRRQGRAQAVESVQTGAPAPGTLLVAGIFAAPGVAVPAGPIRLAFSLWSELCYGGVVDGGLVAAHVQWQPAAGRPQSLFRLGGLELALGLSIGLRLDARPRGE